MAKFYVQSGTFRSVVSADSTRKAALWAVHQVMQQVLPTEEDNDSSANPQSNHHGNSPSSESNQPVAVLDGRVRISERGYDRNDCSELPTMEIVAEWNEMVLTLDRLQRMMHS
ncbi:hypothetical protein LOC71_16755 [Rhodopirellula sp. JC740]|uniref:DRBM domain-containing protein n=1 Tax=Rhodopirellula halodulae TaxID=2894198 RepID=A0ABS8NK43_9BACT|nr:hypothetical protein [Rhodopirellula sp. JC740]MCC9643938.1 hypothetical protein [Rhodopirellula sp. JC740]MCC9657102.1 hypothetical protein [Rhodopirellula sp. JC737]